MSAATLETIQKAPKSGVSVSQAWLRALELTAPIPRQRERTLATVVDEESAHLAKAQEQIKAFEQERETVRQRVERLLKQLDEISV